MKVLQKMINTFPFHFVLFMNHSLLINNIEPNGMVPNQVIQKMSIDFHFSVVFFLFCLVIVHQN